MTSTDIIFKPTFDLRSAKAARANRPIHIPDLPADAPPELAAKLAELTNLRTDLREARVTLAAVGARGAEVAAGKADAAAYASALRAGSRDPGPKHEEKRQADLANAQRRAAGLRQAIGDVETELLKSIEANHDAWIAAAQPATDAARKAIVKAQLALDTAQAALDQQLLFVQWLGDPKTAPRIPARGE